MNIELSSRRERHHRKIVVALLGSVPLLVLVPVARAQTSPAADAADPGPAPAAAPTPPANTAVEPPTQPVAQTPSSAPPPAPAARAAPVTNPPAPAHDDYDGPPLLVGGRGKKKVHVGGYGGVAVAYTRMLNRDGVLIGGEGAVFVDHRLSVGGGGYGFSRTPDGPPAADGRPREFFTGYGGVVIRYAVYSDIPVYASFGALIGGGAVTLAPRNDHDDHDNEDDDGVSTRGFFVVQPDVSVHVNATRWLRFGLMAGYRIATAVDDFGYGGSDLSGIVAGGNIQAGWF